MSAPPANDVCPLTAASRPLSSVAPSNTLDLAQLKALTSQALQLYRSSNTWPSSKTFHLEHESKVVALKGLSTQKGRLAKTAWHARRSEHSPSQSHKLTYQDFYEGLAVDHPIKERQYIHDILKYEQIGPKIAAPTLDENASRYINAIRADIWTTEYQLPMLVGNRDFCEMFLTVEFKPHPDPLSSQHIDEILFALKEGEGSGASATTSESTGGRRSCINIQLPVETPDCAPKTNFVRASYGSVEVLKEMEGNGTEWWMAVQSDSAGNIPLIFQEVSPEGLCSLEGAYIEAVVAQMAMPSKVAPDVPCFIGWAVKDKQSKQS